MSESQPPDHNSPTPLPDLPAGSPAPKGALAIIFLIVFIDLMGFGIIIPLLPFYVNMPQHNPFKVTLLFSIFSLCQFIGSPILGAWSDRIGRRPVLALSQFGSVVGYVLLGFATQFKFENVSLALALVYLSRVIDGFTGGNVSTAQAYISDVTTKENRAKGMGLIGAAFGIGFAFGPFLGGVFGRIHLSLPAYAAAGLSLIAALLTLRKLPESRVHNPADTEAWLHPRRFAPIFRNPVLAQLLTISFCMMAAFVMMETIIALYVNKKDGPYHWEQLGLGLYFGYIGFIILIVQGGLIGKLTKRFGDWPLATTGPILITIAMAGYICTGYHGAFGMPLALLMTAGAVNATGRSLQMPTVSSLLSKFSTPSEQGVLFGLYSGLTSLARFAGPFVAGMVYPFLNNTAPFLVAAIIAVSMACWMVMLRRSVTRGTTTQTPAAPAFEKA
jgi:MFS transporter, DHA1 family, tetracycline resistance protein